MGGGEADVALWATAACFRGVDPKAFPEQEGRQHQQTNCGIERTRFHEVLSTWWLEQVERPRRAETSRKPMGTAERPER